MKNHQIHLLAELQFHSSKRLIFLFVCVLEEGMDNSSRLCPVPLPGAPAADVQQSSVKFLCQYNARAVLCIVQTFLLLSIHAHMGIMLLHWGLCPLCWKEDFTWNVVYQTSHENL